MKLLLDENISFRLVNKIQGSFPASKHISEIGLTGMSDIEIWNFAKKNDYAIVTNDIDFRELQSIYGSPPKLVLLRTGNLSTNHLAEILNSKSTAILDQLSPSSENTCIEIRK